MRSEINAKYASEPDLDDVDVKKTVFEYDENGNMDLSINPLGTKTKSTYDALNRLIESIGDEGSGRINAESEYAYDARDNLRIVTDPKDLDTEYTYNGLGDLTALESPDTGTTSYLVDTAGNRTRQTDARGKVVDYTYDELNRLLTISYPTSSENVAFYYDTVQSECTSDEMYAKGRLTRTTDPSGESRYCYDARGNLTRKVVVLSANSTTHTTRYLYNFADRLMGLRYPNGGPAVDYTRDTRGRVSTVQVNSSNFVTAVGYAPFGPVTSIQFSNGNTITRSFDQNYWPKGVQSNAIAQHYSLNDLGDITELANTAGGSVVERYTYDRLQRLTEVRAANQSLIEAYAYDATGNRTSHTLGSAAAKTYTYGSTTHRLSAIDSVSRTYDSNGNTLSGVATTPWASGDTFLYSDANRLSRVTEPANTVDMRYNGRGERVSQLFQQPTNQVLTAHYDEAGHLLSDVDVDFNGVYCYEPPPCYPDCGEEMAMPEPFTDSKLAAITTDRSKMSPVTAKSEYTCQEWEIVVPVYSPAARHYIWLDDIPIGFRDVRGLRQVHADHLGTPRAVVSGATTMWRWPFQGNAFGAQPAVLDPDADNFETRYPLRFPGQQYDAETGLHYNYFRDYEPGAGRYVESDPIGIRGGIATYGYAGNDSLRNADPSGLFTVDPSCTSCKLGDFTSQVQQYCDIWIFALVRNYVLRECVLEKCRNARISCGDCDISQNADGDFLAYTQVAKFGGHVIFPKKNPEIKLCSTLTNPRAVGPVILHEAAHLCGWNHHMGPVAPPNDVIPGQDGYMNQDDY